MAFSFDDYANSNVLLICDESSDDLETHHQTTVLQPKRQRTQPSDLRFGSEIGSGAGLTDEIVRAMVEREIEHLPRSDYLQKLRSGELDLTARREALDWIWKAHCHYSFGPICICLATNYLDRFLSVYNLPRGKAWTVQLLAVACLSLAAKMDETNVPQSVDLQVGDPKFLFEAKTIQRMELLVLSTLKWRMQALTACSFIDHFLQKIISENRILPSLSSIFRSTQLILGTIGGVDFLEFRPSEIAASVAISILGEIKAVDIDEAISSFVHVEKGRVLKCLELMKDLSLVNGFAINEGISSVSASSSQPESSVGIFMAAFLSYNDKHNNGSQTDEFTVESCSNTSSQTTINSSSYPETDKKRKAEAFIGSKV